MFFILAIVFFGDGPGAAGTWPMGRVHMGGTNYYTIYYYCSDDSRRAQPKILNCSYNVPRVLCTHRTGISSCIQGGPRSIRILSCREKRIKHVAPPCICRKYHTVRVERGDVHKSVVHAKSALLLYTAMTTTPSEGRKKRGCVCVCVYASCRRVCVWPAAGAAESTSIMHSPRTEYQGTISRRWRSSRDSL